MMSKHVVHINPHVMGSGHKRHQSHDDFFGDDLKNFFGSTGHQNPNVHSFTTTYSNVNGHVKRHFTNNGSGVNAKQAKNEMEHMRDQMNQMDRQMNATFGNLDHLMGIGNGHRKSRGRHPINRLLNRFHHRK